MPEAHSWAATLYKQQGLQWDAKEEACVQHCVINTSQTARGRGSYLPPITQWECTFKTVQSASPLGAKSDKWQVVFMLMLNSYLHQIYWENTAVWELSWLWHLGRKEAVANQDKNGTYLQSGMSLHSVFLRLQMFPLQAIILPKRSLWLQLLLASVHMLPLTFPWQV